MSRLKFLIIILFIVGLMTIPVQAESPASDHYKLDSYDFGGGGMVDASGSGIHLNGILGQAQSDQASSGGYNTNAGLQYENQANTPQAPTFTNPANTYDRLKFGLNPGDDPTDTVYAIAISGDDWTTTQYVKNDYSVGNSLDSGDWLTFDTWGGTGGNYVTGLAPDTAYKIKIKAMHGNGTESDYGPEAQATTAEPSLTFGIDHDSVTFDELTSTNNFTDSTKSTTITTSTNAYNGYIVYGHETDKLRSNAETIDDYPAPNSDPTAWSGTGFGYTTNDSNLTGGTGNRFIGGGPNFAGFTTSAPGDPVADHTGPITDNPIVNEQYTVSYRVTAPTNVKAGTYQNTILYTVVPQY
jgi:hypothetical protein